MTSTDLSLFGYALGIVVMVLLLKPLRKPDVWSILMWPLLALILLFGTVFAGAFLFMCLFKPELLDAAGNSFH